MPAPTVRVTTETDEFATWLQRGDVLLFDSIHALSHLIKFAENRPVSHCALYLGDGTFAHVGRHKPGKTRKDPPSVPAARTDSLTEWLKSPPGPYDRTVTALRHIDVSRASDTDGVAGRALEYVAPRNSTYNYLSLVALMVPSLLRTYKHYLKDKAALALVEGAMQAVSNSLVNVFEKDALRVSTSAPSLTCSEFVYRCFLEGDRSLRLEVPDPLAMWPRPGNLKTPTGGPPLTSNSAFLQTSSADSGSPVVATRTIGRGGRETVVDGGDLVTFSTSFRADVLGPPAAPSAMFVVQPIRGADAVVSIAGPSPADESMTAAGFRTDLAVLAGKTLLDMVWTNRRLSKYDPEAGTAHKGDVFADMVTPRDLWSSPSLRAVAVLHRPPSTSDTDLDGVPSAERVAGD